MRVWIKRALHRPIKTHRNTSQTIFFLSKTHHLHKSHRVCVSLWKEGSILLHRFSLFPFLLLFPSFKSNSRVRVLIQWPFQPLSPLPNSTLFSSNLLPLLLLQGHHHRPFPSIYHFSENLEPPSFIKELFVVMLKILFKIMAPVAPSLLSSSSKLLPLIVSQCFTLIIAFIFRFFCHICSNL